MNLLALILLSLGFVVLVSPAPPAWACSCLSFNDQGERADLIVVGTVTEVTETGIRMTVESVEKGTTAADTLRLTVSGSEASCGYAFRTGTRYMVHSVDGYTGLCIGVSPLPAASPTPTVAAVPVAAAPSERSASSWWLAGGAIAAVLAAGLVIIRRRGRFGR